MCASSLFVPRRYLRIETAMSTPLQTEHPHIITVPGVLGGEPVIAGSRISVAFIARLIQAGEEPADIIATYPHLSPAAVYDAISYYLDHHVEIDRLIEESTPEALAERYGLTIEESGKVLFKKS